MCNNYIITRNTTGSVHLLVGPKRPPHDGPHERRPPSPGGRGPPPAIRAAQPPPRKAPRRLGDPHRRGAGEPAPPRSGAASRRHATSILRIISQSSSGRLITLSQVCVYSQQYCLSIFLSWTEIWSNIIGWVNIFFDVWVSNILPLVHISNSQLIINISKYIKY